MRSVPLRSGLTLLPSGRSLPEGAWQIRHRVLLLVLAAHVVLLPAFGVLEGWSAGTSVALVLPSVGFGLLASWTRWPRVVRSTCSALGLLSCSAVLVVLWHGTIEAHFHYFVMTAALALYEEWSVYGLAVGYVVLQHGLMSQVRGDIVFAHAMPMGDAHGMWFWALVHGGFIAALAVANVASWKASETARLQAVEAHQEADEARRKAEDAFELVRHQADHDTLTRALTRACFMQRTAAALAAHGRAGTALAVLFVDLDDFKDVNDSLGHRAGDELIVTVADRLRAALRPGDLLGRFGGDEFVVCLTAPDSDEVERIADRLALAVAAPAIIDGHLCTPTASVGVAIAPGDDLTVGADALVRDADTAMYYAKHRGKARSQLFDATMRVQALDRRSTSASRLITVPAPVWKADGATAEQVTAEELDELACILQRRPIASAYQPIVDLTTREVLGYEALARGPERSPLARPDRLFAAARAAGRVDELDWICREAAVTGARMAGMDDAGPALFVNVEPAALTSERPDHLPAWWEDVVDGMPIVVEFTERALTAHPAELLRTVRQIRRRGWRIALDDVGADVRSIALMPLLRPDIVKLDLRLVQQRPSADVAAIVNAVNAESQRTGAVILAEGIETEEHLATARTLGATVGQGWLFGRPAPLPARLPRIDAPASTLRAAAPPAAADEEVVLREGDRQSLYALSRHLEQQAAALGSQGMLLSAFQTAGAFTPMTRRRYELLAEQSALVVALGVDMPAQPAPGVRGAAIGADDPKADEWSVVVLGPHFSAALLAERPSGRAPDDWRFRLTYDRDAVVAAAASIVDHVLPQDGSELLTA